jgi:hypothetical protein
MGFFHEFVHGCKEVILEEEVRGVTCQRFACPIPVLLSRDLRLHTNVKASAAASARAHMQT